MRLRKCIAGLGIVAMTLALGIGHAGPTTVRFLRAQGVEVTGKLGNGTFWVFLVRLDGVQMNDWSLSVLPKPDPPAPAENVDLGPAGSAAAGAVAHAAYIGCIFIKTTKGADLGCALQNPMFSVDPAMQSASVTVGAKSLKNSGKQLIVNMLLSGTTAVGPAPSNKVTPTADSTHYVGSIVAQQMIQRGQSVIGSARSELVGGGAIVSTSIADIFNGFTGVASVSGNHMFCAPATGCYPDAP